MHLAWWDEKCSSCNSMIGSQKDNSNFIEKLCRIDLYNYGRRKQRKENIEILQNFKDLPTSCSKSRKTVTQFLDAFPLPGSLLLSSFATEFMPLFSSWIRHNLSSFSHCHISILLCCSPLTWILSMFPSYPYCTCWSKMYYLNKNTRF